MKKNIRAMSTLVVASTMLVSYSSVGFAAENDNAKSTQLNQVNQSIKHNNSSQTEIVSINGEADLIRIMRDSSKF